MNRLSLLFQTISLVFALCVLSILNAHAETASDMPQVEYGSVFLEEQRQMQPSAWQLGVSYSYELSNPYANVHGYSLTASHALSKYTRAGLLTTIYTAQDTYLVSAVNQSLQPSGGSQRVQHPSYSMYATIGVTPLAGHLSFFGNQALPFEFNLLFGAGMTRYREGLTEPGLMWSLRPQARIYRSVSFELSAGQQIEAPWSGSDRLSRLEAGAGFIWAFP